MDNAFHQCPPMMSDGRLFTDYRASTRRNEYIKYINGIVRDDDYRMFLQQNTNNVLNKEWDMTRQKKSCWTSPCTHVYPTRMYPAQMPQELMNTNMSMMMPLPKAVEKFKCSAKKDYRMNE
jgi:hypothetical protein